MTNRSDTLRNPAQPHPGATVAASAQAGRGLRLTRAQRRGTPIVSRRVGLALTHTRDARSVRETLYLAAGMSGLLAVAAKRRGWPGPSHSWAGAASAARNAISGKVAPSEAVKRIAAAERVTYQAANGNREAGPQARKRCKRRD